MICKNQQDAISIAEKHYGGDDPNRLLTINGNMLVILTGKDTYAMNDLASWFAGEE